MVYFQHHNIFNIIIFSISQYFQFNMYIQEVIRIRAQWLILSYCEQYSTMPEGRNQVMNIDQTCFDTYSGSWMVRWMG